MGETLPGCQNKGPSNIINLHPVTHKENTCPSSHFQKSQTQTTEYNNISKIHL